MHPTLNIADVTKTGSQDLVRIISHCMEGRFKPGETSRTSAAVMRSLLDYCDVFLGQAAQFQPASVELPINSQFIGEASAFILYDSNKFSAVEHLWSPQNKTEGEVKHAVCKLKSKTDPQLEFFVLSWFVKETYFNYNGVRKCCLLFRQLVQLVQLLGRDLPVLVGGNYQLLPEEAEYLIGREQQFTFSNVDMFCLTSKPLTVRRQIRSCGFFLCGNKFLDPNDENVVGTRSIKGNVILNGCRDEFWRNPEDSFFWDPMTLDLNPDKMIETINACSARNKISTTTPSPVSSFSFNGSEETSLQSEQPENEDQADAGAPDNFASVLASSKLQHLDLASLNNPESHQQHHHNQQHHQEAKIQCQREKLQELRHFLESLELKMDAERTSGSFNNPANYAPHDQGNALLGVDGYQDDVTKSLSTICEHDEHNESSHGSVEDFCNSQHLCGGLLKGNDMFADAGSFYADDCSTTKASSVDFDFYQASSGDNTLLADITPIESISNKEVRYVEGATDEDQGDPKIPLTGQEVTIEKASDAYGNCSVM